MKVLLSAYACEPGKGSEPGVGWSVAKALSDKVSLTVITRANNQALIEGSGEEWVDRVKWIYYDLQPWMMWWKKGGRGVQLYYILWQLLLFLHLLVKKEFKKHDVIHHITFGKYWVPSFLSLSGLPTVFGSVGGGEDSPKAFKNTLGRRGIWEERARRCLRTMMTWNPLCLLALKLNAVNIAATPQTADKLEKLDLSNILVLPQSAISSGQLTEFREVAKTYSQQTEHDGFKVSCVARLISWKGIHLAIEAFHIALESLPEGSSMNILGDGPEKAALKKLVAAKKLDNHVHFIERLPKLEDVFCLMAQSDCVLHPALHEAFGQACLESIAVGTPVICWDWAGPGMIAKRGGGIAICPDSSARSSIEKYAKAILTMYHRSPDEVQKQSQSCQKRASEFTWEKLAENYLKIYQKL